MRFLGTRAPTLLPVTAAGSSAMMALSAWPWLGHVHNGKFQLVPLAYDAIDYVAPFASDKVGEGLVAVVRNAAGTGTLRVLTIDRLGEPFTQRVLKLGFTPRKLLVDEQMQLMITVEADQGIDSYPQRADLQVRPWRRFSRPLHQDGAANAQPQLSQGGDAGWLRQQLATCISAALNHGAAARLESTRMSWVLLVQRVVLAVPERTPRIWVEHEPREAHRGDCRCGCLHEQGTNAGGMCDEELGRALRLQDLLASDRCYKGLLRDLQ